ncbi:glycerol-3-phosphate dehydrogenase/oxidase [Thiobacillus sp.]|uniref:glycerol-3-phosphate dehydrogenase/oxidase n=1 Tax=Thiobacillus sp. TaxID=924 RepID=UPI00184FEB30|nr:glycerol-3-phosphate dehydrogenase/oxidase [Thiobacillus sp.]MBC2730619.1 glycerol-3-phosphate dehydrogenase/oxidase [Thiobacillus sp.]MBC2739356.1 glycerol-3-phosphate dehydrogenase/oxidase [Thiobacillus sp.]MBC2760359.1 glycerol-3-phosphate dehydrogenase/oxidase [Thiobacillus sp.]
MNRDEAIGRLADRRTPWDMIVIGGGATGLGIALDAATRGYDTLLLERDDFAQATSSRSTKLLHGGVRYLRQGNLKLVMGALRERTRVLANAPHLSSEQPFIIPTYKRGESLYYGFGLGVYERLAGRASLGRSQRLSAVETRRELPTLRDEHLRGGVLYHDGQFDDARLAVCLAASAWDHGATLINYCQVTGLLRAGGVGMPVSGVVARDRETGAEHEIPARVVVNATGVFCDSIRRMAEPGAAAWVAPSQGAHIVLDRRFLPGRNALMVPKTDDGRVLFIIPWQNRLLVGTTDVPVEDAAAEPRAQPAEIDFLLEHAGRYLQDAPRREDVLSVFAGLRPLVRAGNGRSTSALARDHLLREESGLVSITGGKWTTYREMAEQATDAAARVAQLPGRPCCTANLALHGATADSAPTPLRAYGSDAGAVQALAQARAEWAAPLHPRLPYIGAEVEWAARHDMARSVQDVLARRTRALLLDARASIEAAPCVAALLAGALGRDAAWQAREVAAFTGLAQAYLACESGGTR